MGALLETGEGSSAAEEDFREAGIKRAVVTKLFEMKFGKGSGENLNLCMDSATSQGGVKFGLGEIDLGIAANGFVTSNDAPSAVEWMD